MNDDDEFLKELKREIPPRVTMTEVDFLELLMRCLFEGKARTRSEWGEPDCEKPKENHHG